MDEKIEISIVLPVYNEVENLEEVYELLALEVPKLNRTFEVIFIDDGSQDGSFAVLQKIATRDSHVKVIRFRRNFGQTAAISAGIDAAKGEILIPMDADLQNHPADIGRLLQKMEEGYDVVSGWRKIRRDFFITRRLPSIMANRLISWISGVHLHDYGCTLKAYRRDVIKNVKLYGEMHRFIPIYAHIVGAKVTEIEVAHYPRKRGVSKYGINRTIKVILDLIIVKFLSDYSNKPIYFFGSIGILANLIAFLCGAVVLVQKYVYGFWAHTNPLLLLAVFLSILGIQLIMMGILAEIEIRTYHESQGKKYYVIQETVNIDRLA